MGLRFSLSPGLSPVLLKGNTNRAEKGAGEKKAIKREEKGSGVGQQREHQ